VFHVTALGPSCCEIQYPQSSRHEEGEESGENGMNHHSMNLYTFILGYS